MKKKNAILPVLTIVTAVLAILFIVLFTLVNRRNISSSNSKKSRGLEGSISKFLLSFYVILVFPTYFCPVSVRI